MKIIMTKLLRMQNNHIVDHFGNSDSEVLRVVRCNPWSCGFEFSSHLCLWDLFPTTDTH